MVKGQRGNLTDGIPPCVSCIIATFNGSFLHQGIISNGNDSPTRIPVDIRKTAQLLQKVHLHIKPRLFLQLAKRPHLCGFVHIQEASGECPTSFIWFYPSFY